MDNLKIKVIGVLREREKDNQNKDAAIGSATSALVGTNTDTSGNAAGATARQLPKMSALDLDGILNCRRRLEWTKEWLKKNQTEFLSKENLLNEMQFRSNETYHLNCFLDITERQFRFLVTKLAPVISTYEPHRKKKSFSAEERLAITLKYLATGEVNSCRNYCFRASKPVILKMIADICLSMYELLKDQFLSLPKTDAQWAAVIDKLQQNDKLPNCLGNLCMQQMAFYSPPQRPPLPSFLGGPPEDQEPKFEPPLVFTAIIDADNNFMYVDIERSRARAYEEIYKHSNIKGLIEGKKLSLPLGIYQEDTKGADSDGDEAAYSPPPYFAGNGSLPAETYLMQSPFYVPTSQDLSYTWSAGSHTPGYHFAYAMDVANFHTDNALRVLTNICPILSLPLRIEEEHARKVTLGAVTLYNYLRKTDHNYFQQTEKMNTQADDIEEIVEDDDCILMANEEELREREEFTPIVFDASCFRPLRKQSGDTPAGLARRERLMKHIASEYLKSK